MEKLAPLKFFSVPRIIDHLGVSAYSNYTKSIKELVANAYDADATKVNIWINKHEILIVDNGSGMDETGIREGYIPIGSGKKRVIKRTPKYNRLPIGNKGIGKLAGFGIAILMEVETIKDDKKYIFPMDKEEMDKKAKLEDIDIPLISEETREKSGTSVRLSKLLPHVEKITETNPIIKQSAKKLREFLATSLPSDSHFEVYVNGIKCTRVDVPYKRRYEIPNSLNKFGLDVVILTTYDLKNKKRIYPHGFIKVARKSVPNPGVITKVRGVAIGEPKIFDLNKGTHKFVHAALITGEVEVPEFDAENEEDKIPVIKTDREGFIDDHPKYITYCEFMTEVLKKICRVEEKEYNRKRQEEVESKVKEAIQNVKDVFNDYNKDFIKSTNQDKTKLKVDKTGKDEVWVGEQKGERKTKGSNPIGITDNSLKEKLKASPGEGNIKLGNKDYKITLGPKGEDDFECLIEDSIRVIYINTDHPAYDHAVMKKGVELAVFRAIASAWAWKVCEENNLSIRDMYEKIDELNRFHAEWNRLKRDNKSTRELRKQFDMNLSIEDNN